jgi:hypothetical protein
LKYIGVQLAGITIQGGSSRYGSINNSGRLTIEDANIFKNSAEFGGGDDIYPHKGLIKEG